MKEKISMVGYCRVSTHDQNLDLQKDALESAGCIKIFCDQVSGSKSDRPGLDEVLNYLRKGDCLVVWRLDRMGRNLKHLISVVEDLEKRGIGFSSLQEGINTSTPGGKLIFHVFGALAEFERCLIQERTQAGLAAARARGRLGGRKRKLTSKQVEIMFNMHDSKKHSIREICKTFGITTPTFYNYLNEYNLR